MEKDQIILLEDRGLISITGEDTKNFLQNIITNDIEKVSFSSTIFSALFTPQGKYLFEFFLIQTKNGYLLDCDNEFTKEIINYLLKYKLRSKINSTLNQVSGLEYSGESKSKHLLHVLVEEIGLEKIRALVKNPLDVNVAGYYGPNMQKEGACSEDNVFSPTYLEQLISALGGKPVNYDLKCQSVGAPSLLTNQSSSLKMTAAVLSDAKENGAQMMVSACTLSHSNLDTYQVKARRITGKNTSMPVIHLAEMVAFALGHHKDRFALLKTRALIIGD